MENVKKVLYRILSIILSIVMVSGSFSGMSLVAEAEENVTLEKSEEVSADMELPENDELFAGYAEQLFYDYEGMETFSIGNQSAGAKLEGDVKKAYDALIPLIKEIAAGERTSTVIKVGEADYAVDKEVSFSGILEKPDLELLLSALLADCPYELYWFDKKTGCSSQQYRSDDTFCYVIFSFHVAANYQGEDKFQVDNSKVNAAKTAAENAKAILKKHESKSDYEKLAAYRNEICELVTYDNSAAETGKFSLNNDPWQLVHVFDGNTSTNVVCEGYSKAFQYLCDQSSFAGKDTACYSVTGTMSSGTGTGPHMWNIVSLANSNYLVDVTNCDSPAIGYPDQLFMVGADDGSIGSGYIVTVSGKDVIYDYDDDQSGLWGRELLTLANSDYTVGNGEVIVEEPVVAAPGVALNADNNGIAKGVKITNNTDTDNTTIYYGYFVDGELCGVTCETFSAGETKTIDFMELLVPDRKYAGKEFSFECYVGNPNWDLTELSERAVLDYEITMEESQYTGDEILVTLEIDEEAQEIYWIEEAFLPKQLRNMYLTNSDENIADGWDEHYYFAPPWPVEGRTCWGASFTDAKISIEKLTLGEVRPEAAGMKFVWSDVPKSMITVERKKEIPTVTFINYNPTKIYDGTPLALPTDEQINISYGLTDIRYEWHKGSVEGEVVSNPIGVGKYVLVAYLEETETTKAVSVISDIFEIKSAPDNELGGVQKTTYTISYELNGGENSPENPSEYIEGAEDIVLKNPARKGYTFQGWYTDSGYKTKISNIHKGSTGNKKVYAKWTKTKYSITYSLNGGKLSSSNPSSYYVTSSTITLKNPTRKGYTFKGWYTESSYKNKITQIPKGSTGNKKLYAKWSAVNYKITYALNNGKNSTSNPATYTIATNTITLKNPTRKGYTFKGWYSDSKYKTKVTKISKGSTGSKKVYAKWAKTKYSITYSLNGGKNSSSNPSNYYITTSTITLKNPTKTGYTFKGWYSDSKYKTKITKISKGSTGSKKVYAKWEANSYTIKFNRNGGDSGRMSSITGRKYGKSYTLPSNNYKRTGWTFAGWNTKKDGSGKQYKNRASVKNLTSKKGGTVTLYAQWKR